MLTEQDARLMAETGMITKDRLRSLQHALKSMAEDARLSARAHPDGIDSQAAAALRGKAMGYTEAMVMVRNITSGSGLHPRRWSTARKLNRAYNARRAERKANRRDPSSERCDLCHDPAMGTYCCLHPGGSE